MTESCAELFRAARQWFERTAAAGWLDDSDRRRFAAVEEATPADLFATQQVRPLVIALFGGTGVGKSSLLNRLAGAPVARVGVERPTSRDVTAYVHESVHLADLPPALPVERVHVKAHRSANLRDVLWVDAPDIDSTDESNRQCALAWLPHVDLLCYVVSPERYRDDAGWRVLQQRGHRHGWMFIMNRWDEGDPQQRADFLGMLRAAGFDDPLLLCTSCIGGSSPTPDEFAQIEALIRALSAGHAARELARLGYRVRLQELRAALRDLQTRLGSEQIWADIAGELRGRWQVARDALLEGTQWEIRSAAARLAVRESGARGWIGARLVDLRGGRPGSAAEPEPGPEASELDVLAGGLWDDWHAAQVGECVDAVEIAVRRSGLPATELRRHMDAAAAAAQPVVRGCIQSELRLAFQQRGGILRRAVLKILGFLGKALPLAAMVAVAYQLVAGYYRATLGHAPYLGLDFAIHSGMLVAVAWAIPLVIGHWLRPSLEQAVSRALRTGLRSGCDAVGAALEEALAATTADAQNWSAGAQELLDRVTRAFNELVLAPSPVVARLLIAGAKLADVGGSAETEHVSPAATVGLHSGR